MPAPQELVDLEEYIKRLKTRLATVRAQAADLAAKKIKAEAKVQYTESVYRNATAHFDHIRRLETVPLVEYQRARDIMWESENKGIEASEELAMVWSAINRNMNEVPLVEELLAAATVQLSKWCVVIPFEKTDG